MKPEYIEKAKLIEAVEKAFPNDNPMSCTVRATFKEIVDSVLVATDVNPADTAQILKHLDALCHCVQYAYDTSCCLLESEMRFVEKQEAAIIELLTSPTEEKPYVSSSTASGYKYRCPNCHWETLTTGNTFCCEHCGYEMELDKG